MREMIEYGKSCGIYIRVVGRTLRLVSASKEYMV